MKKWNELRRRLPVSVFQTASLYATFACYYIILSVFPAGMFAVTVLPHLSLPFEIWQSSFLPPEMLQALDYLRHAMQQVSSPPIFSFSVIIWIWSASKGIHAVSQGFDAVLQAKQEDRMLRKRIVSMLNFLLLSVSLLLTMLIQVFGRQILDLLQQQLPFLSSFLLHFRTLWSFLFLTGVFAVLYRIHPNSPLPFRICLYGGMLCAAGWICFSFLFSIYVTYFSGQYRILGNLGALLLTSIWLRYCMMMLFLGISFSKFRWESKCSVVKSLISLFKDIHE